MKLKTNVIARTYNAKGELVKSQKGHNDLTKANDPSTDHNALVWLLERMFEDGTNYDPDNFVDKMQLGTGTADDTGLGTPITSPIDTMLAFTSLTLDSTPETAPTMTAVCDWDSTYGALSGVTEAGLFADDSGASDTVMIARKAFSPALSKETGGTIQLEWVITIS